MHYDGGIWKHSFISTVRCTVHTNWSGKLTKPFWKQASNRKNWLIDNIAITMGLPSLRFFFSLTHVQNNAALEGKHLTCFQSENYTAPQMIPDHKWSPDRKWSRNWTTNAPGPKMIPDAERKWSRRKTRNGKEFVFLVFYFLFYFYFIFIFIYFHH